MVIAWRRNPKEFGKSVPLDWEESLQRIIKVRTEHNCLMCDKKIRKGCYALGDRYWRVCLECSGTFFQNLIESLKEQIEFAKTSKSKIDEDMGELIKNNVVNSL